MNAQAPQPRPDREPAPLPPPLPHRKRHTEEDMVKCRVTNEFILTKEQYEELMKESKELGGTVVIDCKKIFEKVFEEIKRLHDQSRIRP
jgi:thymidylate kinase